MVADHCRGRCHRPVRRGEFYGSCKDNSEHEAVCGFLNSRAPHHLLPRRAFAELFLKAETLEDWKDWKDCREKLTDKTAPISLS